MIYQRNMENKKNCTLNENTNTSSLPVVFSEKLENKIQDVINYNKHNKDGISEWAKSLEYLSKYLSQRQIAFDYGGQHNYDRYEENETITITKIHYVTYKIIEDKNGRIYVEIVGAKLKPLDYGLEIPPSFTESKETSNQYISLRDYITEQKYINTINKMKSLNAYITENKGNQVFVVAEYLFLNYDNDVNVSGVFTNKEDAISCAKSVFKKYCKKDVEDKESERVTDKNVVWTQSETTFKEGCVTIKIFQMNIK